jgi:Fur family transcriptional regulator, peroxide stress response regulator
MEVTIQFLTDELSQKGIRPSYQRVKVLEYLYQKECHPTVEEIYQHLSPHIPSLSKTTIYNTLRTFVEAGLARSISIDDVETRYDSMLANHGHFQCTACGAIINFSIDIDSIPIAELNQFQIKEKNVYYKGLCPNCLDQSNKNEE